MRRPYADQLLDRVEVGVLQLEDGRHGGDRVEVLRAPVPGQVPPRVVGGDVVFVGVVGRVKPVKGLRDRRLARLVLTDQARDLGVDRRQNADMAHRHGALALGQYTGSGFVVIDRLVLTPPAPQVACDAGALGGVIAVASGSRVGMFRHRRVRVACVLLVSWGR